MWKRVVHDQTADDSSRVERDERASGAAKALQRISEHPDHDHGLSHVQDSSRFTIKNFRDCLSLDPA